MLSQVNETRVKDDETIAIAKEQLLEAHIISDDTNVTAIITTEIESHHPESGDDYLVTKGGK